MTTVVLVLAVGYGFVVALLVLILFSTSVPAVLRIVATLMAVALFFTTYWGVGELRGLPSDTRPPESFRLHWARIVEPNELTGDDGAIYLWIEKLDDDNYPSGLPRAYELPYSHELADTVRSSIAAISGGEDVAGEISEESSDRDTSERLAAKIAQDERGSRAEVGERFYSFDFGDLSFGETPAPVTPEKAP